MAMTPGGAIDARGIPPEAGARPIALLPFTQLARISAYWLGLTAIDAAVGLYIGYQPPSPTSGATSRWAPPPPS
jgi:hypothetical protein